ncbi:MAG: 3-isopropylmalate dehydratase, partial [Pseudomonadota bacterium]|nr:3-isopropylmalate dehydratase [Pseudomonadota bacterium]
SARPIGNVFARLGVAGIIASTFNGLGLRNCVNYGVHVLPCPGAIDAIADGDRIAVDWQAGTVRNLSQESEISGKALPQALLDIAEAGGVIPVLKSEGLLEDAE